MLIDPDAFKIIIRKIFPHDQFIAYYKTRNYLTTSKGRHLNFQAAAIYMSAMVSSGAKPFGTNSVRHFVKKSFKFNEGFIMSDKTILKMKSHLDLRRSEYLSDMSSFSNPSQLKCQQVFKEIEDLLKEEKTQPFFSLFKDSGKDFMLEHIKAMYGQNIDQSKPVPEYKTLNDGQKMLVAISAVESQK